MAVALACQSSMDEYSKLKLASKILDDCVFINSILDDCVFINKNAGAYFNHKDQTKYLKAHMNYLRQ